MTIIVNNSKIRIFSGATAGDAVLRCFFEKIEIKEIATLRADGISIAFRCLKMTLFVDPLRYKGVAEPSKLAERDYIVPAVEKLGKLVWGIVVDF